MKVKISELRRMIQEQYKEVLDHECVEDVKAQEDTWAGGENLVNKIDHKKAYNVKEGKRGKKIKVRKMRVNELKNLVLESVKNSTKSK